MTRIRGPIDVTPPEDDARRERIERGVFAELAAGRSEQPAAGVAREPAAPASWGRLAMVLGGVALGIAAVVAVLVVRHDPMRSSRLTLDGAIVDVAGDSEVHALPGEGGAITLVLGRGAVDCDVEPRPGRPPFRVVAGGVTVEVVGTRFRVARGERVQVTVSRGKVRILAAGGEQLVGAGQSWSEGSPLSVAPPPREPSGPLTPPAATAPPVETVEAAAPAELEARAPEARAPADARAALSAAQALERSDPAAAARAYRAIAGDSTVKSTWAALAVYSLAELASGRGQHREALAALDDYERRFPRGANAEDAAWLRVEVLRAARDPAATRAAARAYLTRFPEGTYAGPARRIAEAE